MGPNEQGEHPTITIDRSRDWPYNAYMGKCSACGHHFGGPKRASVCFLCANPKENEDGPALPVDLSDD